MYKYVCLYVGNCTRVQVFMEARGIKSTETGVTDMLRGTEAIILTESIKENQEC